MLKIKRSKSIPIFGKNKKNDFQNKMTVKLMNEYAENYKYLEKQYKQLKQELSDTKTNLQISKEIIDVFMTKCSDPKLKFSEIIKSLNKKINWYHEINTKLVEDNTTLNNLVNNYNLNISKLSDELDFIKTKYFILEQANKKKDNTIKNLKNCTEIKDKYNHIVINPTNGIIKLNSELEYYKDLFYKLYRNAKKYKEKLEFYERQVNFLQTEKEKLRVKNREQKMQANKDKDNIFLYLRRTLTNIALNDKSMNKSFNILKSDNNPNNIGSLNILGNLNKSALNKTKGNEIESFIDNKILDTLLKTENSFYENKKGNKIDINNDDFVEILKQSGLTQEEFIDMSKNPINSKLTDVIEFMYKMIAEKTQTINLLECENENLNQENFELNKKNMELMKNKELDDSLITNNSKITIKNVNINTLSNYQKILYNNSSNVQEEINKINKIFNSKMSENINNKEKDNKNQINNIKNLKNNININIIKSNNEKKNEDINNNNTNKGIMNNQKLLGQLSFTSVNSSEVDKEIGENSFLSDSSENNS